MIDPPPLPIRCGTAAAIVCQTPVRLVSIVSCQTAGGHLVPGLYGADARVRDGDVQLAELRDALVDGLPDGGGVPDVGLPGDDLPAERRHGLDRVREILLLPPLATAAVSVVPVYIWVKSRQMLRSVHPTH